MSVPPEIRDNFKAWIGKLTRNAAINKWKFNHRHKRNDSFRAITEELEECIPDAIETIDHIEAIEMSSLLSKWLNSISEENRIIFIQRYWFGYNHAELAEIFATNKKNITGRLYYLRCQLKKYLEENDVWL